jgi:glutathione S-transferase
MQPNLVLCELGTTGIETLESFSPFCLKVHRALKAARLQYTSIRATRPDEFKKLNPAAQVPVLLIDDEPVSDSTRILQRIDQIAPGRISPGDSDLKVEAAMWEELADTSLNGFLVAARWLDDRNWPITKQAYFSAMPGIVRAIVPSRIRANVRKTLQARDVIRHGMDATWKRFEELLDLFEARAPESTFWVGRSLSFADFAIYAQLAGMQTPLTVWQSAKISERSRLASYLARVDSATREAVSIATPNVSVAFATHGLAAI